MTRKNGRLARIVAGVAIAAVAAYWYWSPYLDIRQMASAAQEKDADAFNDHVDYPKLRESIKGQFSARMAAAMPKEASDNAFAGLGAMIGMGLVNQMVEVMVRPEFVMKAMQEGKMSPPGRHAASGESNQSQPKWDFERKGVNRVIAYPVDAEQPQSKERPGFVFERNGFAHWKLTELRLPETL